MLIEYPRISKFKFRFAASPPARLLDEPCVRKLRLRILVERLHVRVRWGRIEIEVGLLHILAMITLGIRQAEQPLFQDGVAPVPQGQCETKPTLTIANSQQPILTPAIRPAACMIVREVIPALSIGRIILAHRAPLTL